MPFSRNSVPSVVTKDGMPSTTVTTPLTSPTSAEAPTASSSPTSAASPASTAKCMMNGANAKIMPADRSISPPIISMISPQAMMVQGATNCDRFTRLGLEPRKSLFWDWK